MKTYRRHVCSFALIAFFIAFQGINSIASAQNPPDCGTEITDVDGNTYKTVQIGTQCWMAENLRTSKFRDGTPIPKVTRNSRWGDLTTGAWAHSDNKAANETVYGKLYNWYAVADARHVCPTGWHVPSDAEWTMLSAHLGTDPGHKMKSTSGWSSNGNGSNASGFAGLPGGSRDGLGSFSNVGSHGTFWSSTQINAGLAWYGLLYYDNPDLTMFNNFKSYGFSVRCVRD